MKFNFITTRDGNKVSDNRKLITKQTFFSGDDRTGYMEKSTFAELMAQLQSDAPGLLKQYKNCFDCLKDGFTLTNGISKQTHKVNGADYYYLRFKKGNIDLPATVYEVERLGQFIKDYGYGIIRIDFTFEELMEEARNN